MSIERFVVDSRLLRELGERLVGRPHIALAELIKNSYDADARVVEVYFSDHSIKVVDDGHGMSHADFSRRWLTIGTTIKEQKRESPELRRPFTGSKGVGRLSVQLLARQLELRTVGLRDPELAGRRRRLAAEGFDLYDEVHAYIDWNRAVSAGHIEDVEVEVTETLPSQVFTGASPCGTELVLTGLTHDWDADAFRDLARELWPLQPPFAIRKDDESAFEVVLHSAYKEVVQEFNAQMKAILDIWQARVVGTLLPVQAKPPSDETVYELIDNDSLATMRRRERSGNGPDRLLSVIIEFRRGSRRRVVFRIPDCHIDRLEYEVRIFNLRSRQPQGVKVETARQYMHSYGGVHIYDANFHLPYYGPDNDWLRIEQDHARRLSASKLLPADLQVARGMLDLVPNSRIYGAVQISTTHEAEVGQASANPIGDILTMQITRDRLAENTAFEELRSLVRAGMDLYAMENARAKFAEAKRRRDSITKPPSTGLRDTSENLASMRDSIPKDNLLDFDRLREQFEDAVADAEALEHAVQAQTSLLGALATAGITALAYEHEISKQIATVEKLSRRITKLSADAPEPLRSSLMEISRDLLSLADRTQRIKAIFAPLTDEENRTNQDAGSVFELLEELSEALDVLSRGTKIDYSHVPRTFRFPRGGYTAWWAIFQNVFINAFNATLDTDDKTIVVDASGTSATGSIVVQDSGIGIDLSSAERMFDPFERGRPISRERAALALGGSGLGLTIVRLVAEELGVQVVFEKPQPQYSTAIRISWRATK